MDAGNAQQRKQPQHIHIGHPLPGSSLGGVLHMYSPNDMEQFVEYMSTQLDTVEPEINREDLRRIFLDIYANPVVTKELLEKEKRTGAILI